MPAILQPALFLLVPESPRYLFIHRKDVDGAVKSLRLLRGGGEAEEKREEGDGNHTGNWDPIASDLRQMEDEARQEIASPHFNLKSIVSSPVLSQPFLITVVLHLSQQLCGINAIFYYSTALFRSIGLSVAEAVYASIGASGFLVLATLISVPLMEKVGRKTLMATGLALIITFEILMSTSLSFFEPRPDGVEKSSGQWAGVVGVIGTVAAFAIGPGSIPWFFPAEIFPQVIP